MFYDLNLQSFCDYRTVKHGNWMPASPVNVTEVNQDVLWNDVQF